MNIKLVMAFTYFAKKYGSKLLSLNNPEACAGFLGAALRDQRKIIEDDDSGTLITLYDSLERLLEIKVLMHWTAAKMKIPTKGQAPAVIMSQIAEKCHVDNEKASQDIKETLKWAQTFFSRPDVQEIFSEADIEVIIPKNPLHFHKTIISLGMRIQQEAERLHKVLSVAKDAEGGDKPTSNDNATDNTAKDITNKKDPGTPKPGAKPPQ